MGRIKFNKTGITKIQSLFQYQVLQMQKRCAELSYTYLTQFGYHVERAKEFESKYGGGYSFYYVANWNVGVGCADTSVISPERHVDNDIYGRFSDIIAAKGKDYVQTVTDGILFGSSITVTNSVYYGKWLNYGGYLKETFAKNSTPNYFIEQCYEFVKDNVKVVAQRLNRDCPGI